MPKSEGRVRTDFKLILAILGLTAAFGVVVAALSVPGPRSRPAGLLSTLTPTARPSSAPTSTPLPTATHTPAPTDTPIPTFTLTPTNTPIPTLTPTPTDTPVPTNTPIPTTESLPTIPITATPEIGDPLTNYVIQVVTQMQALIQAMGGITQLVQAPDPSSEQWRLNVTLQAAIVRLAHLRLTQMASPPEMAAVHNALLHSTGDCDQAALYLASGINVGEPVALGVASELFQSCSEKMSMAITLLGGQTLRSTPRVKADETPSASVSSESTPIAIIQAENLNVRTGPGVNYEVATTVRQGDRLEVLASNQGRTWLKTAEGWVSASYVELSDDINTLPIAITPRAPVTAEPTAAIGPAVVILSVDREAEYAEIQNSGDAAQDLSGWILRSERDEQDCALSGVLPPGQTLRIWAMAFDAGRGGYNCGFEQSIWDDSKDDPAVLFDATGSEVDRQ